MQTENTSTREKIWNFIHGLPDTSKLDHAESEDAMLDNINSMHDIIFKGLAKQCAKDAASHILVGLAGCVGIGVLVTTWQTNNFAKTAGAAAAMLPTIPCFAYGVKNLISTIRLRKLLKSKGLDRFALARKYSFDNTLPIFKYCEQIVFDAYDLYYTHYDAKQMDKAESTANENLEVNAEKREKLHKKIADKYDAHIKYFKNAADFFLG